MPSGKTHEFVLITLILPVISFYLGWIHADKLLSLYFYILYLIGTYVITCDNDTKSRSTKRLWIIGWCINLCFKHRGFLHSPWLWIPAGIAGYYFVGWWSLGVVIPNGIHIVMDKVF